MWVKTELKVNFPFYIKLAAEMYAWWSANVKTISLNKKKAGKGRLFFVMRKSFGDIPWAFPDEAVHERRKHPKKLQSEEFDGQYQSDYP